MKPQQLARLLNISPVTLRQWARETYSEFLSPSAQGTNGAHRSFTDQDARIIAWIAMLKGQNTPTNDIVATLRSAQANSWRNLPPLPSGGIANDEPIAVVPREAVEERIHALQERYETQLQAVVKERDQLKSQIETLERQIDTLRLETSETLKVAQQQSLETYKQFQQRITDLTAQEAELRGKLEQYTFGGHRLNAVVLVAIALVAGVIVTLLIMALSTSMAGR